MRRAAAVLVLLQSCTIAAPARLSPGASTPFGLFELDEAGGLFGVKLGAPEATIPGARRVRREGDGASFFESDTLPRRLGDAALTSLSFAVHDGVVVAILFEVDGEGRAALLSELERRFGGPSSTDAKGLGWEGGHVKLRWEHGPDGALLLLFDEAVLREHGARLPARTL